MLSALADWSANCRTRALGPSPVTGRVRSSPWRLRGWCRSGGRVRCILLITWGLRGRRGFALLRRGGLARLRPGLRPLPRVHQCVCRRGPVQMRRHGGLHRLRRGPGSRGIVLEAERGRGPCAVPSLPKVRKCCAPPMGRDALEGKAPQRRPQRRLDRRLEEVTKAVGGGHCWLQMPWRPALGVRETAAGHRLGALEGGGGLPPFQCIPADG